MQIFSSNLNVWHNRGPLVRRLCLRTRTQLGARAAGVAILLFIYVEIFPVYRLDTSLLIFEMQILHLTISSIMQLYLPTRLECVYTVF